jgi:hypothetical protein
MSLARDLDFDILLAESYRRLVGEALGPENDRPSRRIGMAPGKRSILRLGPRQRPRPAVCLRKRCRAALLRVHLRWGDYRNELGAGRSIKRRTNG